MNEQQEFEKRMSEYIDRQNRPTVKFKKLHDDAKIPEYQTKGSAGFDLASLESVIIYSKQVRIVSTGLALEIPQGYELQIRPRSGTSVKTKLRIANAPGTIDSDYRGEIGLIIENTGDDFCKIEAGERIAQGVLSRVQQARFEQIEELSVTERGEGGFGSTGK